MAQEKRNGVHGEDGATFEQSFKRLQEVVAKLSEGNLTLQEALAAFEEGMELADRCTQMLDGAELRLRQVSASASRSAAQSIDDLEEVSRHVKSAEDEGGELIAIEMQSVESTLVFEAPKPAPLPMNPSGRIPNPLTGDPPTAAPNSRGQALPASDVELDPLFDEDD